MQENKEPVTIIIPVHNSNGYIIKTVDSIYNSTKYPFKIMLIESNSTDSSKGDCDFLANKYKEVEVHNINVQRGQQAINYGLKNSKGNVFITHDDVIVPKFEGFDWLQRMDELSEKKIKLEDPDTFEINTEVHTGMVTSKMGGGISGPEYINGFKWVGTWATYITRKAINEVGYYDENMKIGDDIDYTYRIKKAGFGLLTLTEFFVDHHRLNDKPQDSKDSVADKIESAKYFRKKHNLDKSNLPVIVGIPVKNDLESLKEMITSLIDSTNFYCKIVIIECDSNDETKEFLDVILSKFPRIEIHHITNETSLQAYNRLFKIAEEEGKDLLLTQTDVIFPKLYKQDWLRGLYNVANQEGHCIATSLNGGGTSGPDYIDGFYWVGGWCTYVPLKTIKVLKGFDEDFPNGYGVDVDFSYRASKIGQMVMIDYWVHHHMQNDRKHDNDPNTELMKKEGGKFFKKKWNLK